MAEPHPAGVKEPGTPAVDPAGEETDSPETTGNPRRGRIPRRVLLWYIGGALAVVALVVSGLVAWNAVNSDSTVLSQVAGSRIAKDPQNPGMVTYTDPGTRFRLDFPSSWRTSVIGGADVRLLAGPGNDDLISVRVVTLDTDSSGSPTQASIRPYLDTIVQEPTVRIVRRDEITMDRLPGWYYVYTFTDSKTHREGVHAQYFILRGSELYSIVFQALPASDFSRLAPVYQQVANSIQFY